MDPTSPLLFMLFVNDIVKKYICVNSQHIFTINALKSFLILFADDQVLLATSHETLQSFIYPAAKETRKLVTFKLIENKIC